MPIAIWIAAVMIAPYWLWIDEKKSLQSTLINDKCFNSALFTMVSTLFIELGGFVMSEDYDGGKTLERKERK